ncbi:tetratricopeptide repeat protein [Pendulispora rubella]|uniref:Tetratricopeptide repeat protein n=1 Tax=Pendulispora rubella TaxID=2741070 RepID=A0ABZ2LHS5_9BACT
MARSSDVMPSAEGDQDAPLRIGARVGRYVILDWLGAGGMGVVYAAHDPELDRTVALKLLRPSVCRTRPDRGERFLGEARAMARVGHPNVITVFDVGTHGESIFIAMERADGPTLGDWLHAAPRTWQAIVNVFIEAGRGLEAAHDAGLVHRDFKPDNVLIGKDGRARVSDFGLAGSPAGDEDGVTPHPAWTAGGHGTPGYMAPEHAHPDQIDARTDQFSFCVALYEALCGVRPFAGGELGKGPAYGRVPEPPPRVPRRIARAVLRGLSLRKEDRFPSMGALLAVLAPPTRAGRRLVAMGCVALALGIGIPLAMHHRAARPTVCAGTTESKLAGVWDAPVRERVHTAFLATKKPYAEDTWRKTDRILSSWTSSWQAMNTDVCEATHVRHEQSPALMDLRTHCLADELRVMKARTATLATADAKTLHRAVESVLTLPGVDACADGRALLTKEPPPADPIVRARLDDIGDRVAQAGALEKAGNYARALEIVTAAVRDAGTLGYPPLLAEALGYQGNIQMERGEDAPAVASFYSSIEAAEIGRDDLGKARALVALLWVVGDHQARFEDARRIAQLAQAAVERAGGDSELRARLAAARHSIFFGEGNYEEARRLGDEAVALWTKARGADYFEVAISLNNAALADRRLGDLAGTLAKREKAWNILQRAIGERHPKTGIVQGNVAVSLADVRRFDEAAAVAEQARDIVSEALRPDHPQVAAIEDTMATIRFEQGRYADALPHALRSAEIMEAELGPEHPDLAEARNTVGRIENRLGKLAEALRLHQRALVVWERLNGTSTGFANTLQYLGEDWLASGRPGEAIAPLERALSLRSAPDRRQDDCAETRFTLARALAGAHRNSGRVRTLAEEALSYYERAPGRNRDRDEVAAFLRTVRQATSP